MLWLWPSPCISWRRRTIALGWRLRGLQRDRAWLLKATGYFRQVQFAEPPRPRDRAAHEAMQIRVFAQATLKGMGLIDGEGNLVKP